MSGGIILVSGTHILLIYLGITLLILFMGYHKIDEGHVGVYFRGGALLPDLTEAGYHWHYPIITDYHNVQVTVQTDKVTDIPVNSSKHLK